MLISILPFLYYNWVYIILNREVLHMKLKRIKKLTKLILKIVISLSILCCIFMSLVFYCNLKPFKDLRTLWVTTAMTTFNHQWLATMFISKSEIDSILNANKVVTTTAKTNTSKIKISHQSAQKDNDDPDPDITPDLSKFSNSENVSIIPIKGTTYIGKLMIVDNPSRIRLGTINNFGKNSVGLRLSTMAKKYDAIAALNASGFQDDNGTGSGGTPIGLVVRDGKIVYHDYNSQTFNIVGFDYSNRLLTGQFTLDDISKYNIRDAVSFGPALIINGKPVEIDGNGGFGLQPRSAIGQTVDGKVLLLEIDGRQPLYSAGAYITTVQSILMQYGAINACNLDGGSSTGMYYHGKIINRPCGPLGSTGGRYIPTAFLVTN
jgi:exopolysaccharide biosynthesis protein